MAKNDQNGLRNASVGLGFQEQKCDPLPLVSSPRQPMRSRSAKASRHLGSISRSLEDKTSHRWVTLGRQKAVSTPRAVRLTAALVASMPPTVSPPHSSPRCHQPASTATRTRDGRRDMLGWCSEEERRRRRHARSSASAQRWLLSHRRPFDTPCHWDAIDQLDRHRPCTPDSLETVRLSSRLRESVFVSRRGLARPSSTNVEGRGSRAVGCRSAIMWHRDKLQM